MSILYLTILLSGCLISIIVIIKAITRLIKAKGKEKATMGKHAFIGGLLLIAAITLFVMFLNFTFTYLAIPSIGLNIPK